MRILIFKAIDPSSDWLLDSFRKLGHEAELISERDANQTIREKVESFKPDIALFNNIEFFVSRPDSEVMEDFLNQKGLPVAIWYFEPPHWMGGFKNIDRWNEGRWNQGYLYFQIDSGYISDYLARGLTCRHLPFAANPAHENFKPNSQLVGQYQWDVSYIGQPWFKDIRQPLDGSFEAIRDFHESRMRADIEAVRAIYLEGPEAKNFIEAATLEEKEELHRLFSKLYISTEDYQRDSRRFIQKITKRMPSDLPKSFTNVLEGRLDICYSVFRQAGLLHGLIEKSDIHIYGGDEWLRFFPHYRHGSTRYLTNEELYVAYHAAKIVIKDTKHIFRNVVHERVPHVLAVGGFPLVDYRKDIDDQYEKDELAVYHSVGELFEKIDFYLKNESARQSIAKKGRARVLRDHTYLRRAEQIIAYAKNFFGAKLGA